MNEILRSRENLSPDEVFNRYYAGSNLNRKLVVELLDHVAAELSLPVEKLRPNDRFAVELAPKKGSEWDSGYGILLYELQRLAKKKGRIVKKSIATIDDYLMAMSEVY